MAFQSAFQELATGSNVPGPLLPECRLQALNHDPGCNHAPFSKSLPRVAGFGESSQLATHNPPMYCATILLVLTSITFTVIIAILLSPAASREGREHIFGQHVLAKILHVNHPSVYRFCRLCRLCRLCCLCCLARFLSRLVACLSL